MTDPRPHVFDLTPDQLGDLVKSWGMPAFRAKQILHWLYRQHVANPARMTNLPKRDRDLLAHKLRWTTGSIIQHQRATDGVQKLLLDWSLPPEAPETPEAPPELPPEVSSANALGVGGERSLEILGQAASQGSPETQTECVMIPAGGQDDADADGHPPRETASEAASSRARRTACISSQIGCPVGCKFCASGLGGLDGNLTAGQIIEQVWQLGTLPGVIDADPSPDAHPITNIVFMGMGEPLANFEQVVKAARHIMSPWNLNISGRRITISTVGVPAQIRRLAEIELPVTLAISLHAPNDEIRRQLIPWAQRVTIAQLMDAARYYFDKTGREVTLEYILLRNVNDRPEHARELASVARKIRGNVNLIRYNEVAGLPFDRPTTDDVRQFQQILRSAGVNTHIRASRGRDIAAACGQLRHEHANA